MELPPWPYFDSEDIEIVVNTLKSGKVSTWTGTQTKFFEKEFSEFLDVKHSIALANGTVALTAAYMSLGIGAGDEVITCLLYTSPSPRD